MKIYEIALFLLITNLSISLLGALNIFPVHVSTLAVTEEEFRGNIPDKISYSNADIGLYLFGDFPRALGMLGKIFVFAPITLVLLLGEAGIPGLIITPLSILVWCVYLIGLAQVIMKFTLVGGE